MPFSVDSNSTQAYFGEEAALGVQSAGPFYPLEPNDYSDWGTDAKSITRNPINIGRKVGKGTIATIDIPAGWQQDWTQTNLSRLAQGYFFADILDKPQTAPMNTAAIAVASVAPGSVTLASALATIKANDLVLTQHFLHAANNTVQLVSGVAGAVVSGTVVQGGPALVAEGAPPANASLTAVGYRLSATATLSGLASAPVILSDTGGVDFTTLGLSPGELIYIGDVGNASSAANFNFVGGTSGVILRGYARIAPAGISATALIFDFVTFGNGDSAGATTAGVNIWFGSFLFDQATLSTIKRRSYTLPRYLGKGLANANQLEVLLGCVPDKLTLNVSTAAKLTADLTMVGINSLYQNLAMLTGTIAPGYNEDAFNTSRSIYASLFTLPNQDNASLFAYSSETKFMIDNGAAVTRALGSPSGFDIDVDDFKISNSGTAFFADIAALQAVQTGANVGAMTIFAQKNAGMIFDVPLVTLGGGKLDVKKGKKITANITADGAVNAAGYTASYTQFKYLPNSAMSGYAGL